MEYLHLNNIGHLDIKTENLLIDKNYDIKIADFGCSKPTKTNEMERKRFDVEIAVGSPEFNPPEITNAH